MLAPRAQAPVARLVLALLAIPGVLSMSAPSCAVKEYCAGQEPNTFGSGSTVQTILNDLRNTFCGCKRIGGSVNVFFPPMLTDNYSLAEDDFNFLYHLEEVGGGVSFFNVPPLDRLTLPELVLIRGNSLASGGYALSLVNSQVDEFVLPKLVEITVGSMQLRNSTWCGYYTVNWEDIFEAGSVHLLPNDDELNFTKELNMRCPSEDRQCSGCASGHCWAPGDNTTCQTLTKTVCPSICPERCFDFEGSKFCCNTICAAGCSGTTGSDCVACEQFNNNGTCVAACPRKITYDFMERQFVVNPDGRVAAGDQCLEDCPQGLFDLDGSCVVSCPENHMVDNNMCVACVGPCPQGTECQGWSGTESVGNDDILQEFLNKECVIVNGHIRFNGITAECRNQDVNQFCDQSDFLSETTLQRFQYVKVIRGQLQISGWNRSLYPSLPMVIDYFRNVEYISSLNLTLNTVNTVGDALVISTNPGLERVDLSRLRAVRYGNVRVRRNPELCYVGDFQTTNGSNSVYLTETELILPNESPANFKSVEACNADGMTCNEECNQTSRCWGPDDTNCVACVSYRYPPLWRCVPNCDEYNDTFPNNDTKECEQCHDECIGCCDRGPFQCKACRNFRIVHNAAGDGVVCHNGTECVSACPGNYYADGMDCKLCNELCVGGCTGPGNFVGQGGCNACDFVNFDQNDTQISCVAQCPAGTYKHQLEQAIGPVPELNGACYPCHDLCETCFGSQNTECFECKYAALENTTGNVTVSTCLAECPSDRYKAASKVCRECHEECDGCVGQGNKMCRQCRNVRVVVPQAQAPTIYECLGSCPNRSYWIDYANANTCIPCHFLCVTCVGPGNSNCTQCNSLTARPVENNLTTSGVNVTLYTCEATAGLFNGGPGNLPWWGTLLLTVGLPLVLILILVVIVYLLCRAWRNRLKDVEYEGKAPIVDNPVYGTWDELAIEMEMLPQPKVAPNLSKITIIPEDSLKLEDVLGSGAFGTVHKGYWSPEGEEFEYTVAVKVLNENTAAEATSELLDEGVAMASMDHPYVVRLFGISMGRKMMLVSQFVPLGSLLDFLRKHKERLNAKNMLTFSHQIAEGMAYLEQNRMVHRDLAARNVLVQSASNVKITDFGLSKCLDVGESGYKAGQGKVPVRWLAPECLRSREFSHKSDVWAFGVTVWEILTFGARPYKDKKPQEMLKYLESGQRLVQPPTCTIDLYKVLLKCWLLEPNQRPAFNTLAVQFDSMCLDPLRYLSTLVDGQMDDYSTLPCNDAEEVDKHVYETPLDLEGHAMAFSEQGDYDNPDDEGAAYLNPVPSVKANPAAGARGKEELVATISDSTVENSYNYIVDTGVEESVKANEYADIDDHEVDGAKEGVKANEYAYIDDHEVDGAKEGMKANEYADIDDHEVDGAKEGVKANEYAYIDDHEVDGAKEGVKANEYADIDDHEVDGAKEQGNEYNYIDDAMADKDGQEPQLSRMDEYDEYPAWNTVGFNPMANQGDPFV